MQEPCFNEGEPFDQPNRKATKHMQQSEVSSGVSLSYVPHAKLTHRTSSFRLAKKKITIYVGKHLHREWLFVATRSGPLMLAFFWLV